MQRAISAGSDGAVTLGNTARKTALCPASTVPTRVAHEEAPTAGAIRPYMSIEQLAAATPWTVPAIRKMMARGVLKRDVHYFQPLGRRREVVFKWSAIVAMIEHEPQVVKEPEAQPRQPRSVDMDVEQATANFERMLG